MLERQCDHCDKSIALYWVSFTKTPAVSFAHAGGRYHRPGSGVLVWARTVDDAQAAVLGRAVGLSHPVIVCPLSEFPGILQGEESANRE